MSSPPSADKAFSAGLSEVESVLYQFEQAWRSGNFPQIEAYWPPSTPLKSTEDRQRLLEELIKIDLERRWRAGVQLPLVGQRPASAPSAPAKGGPRLEDY